MRVPSGPQGSLDPEAGPAVHPELYNQNPRLPADSESQTLLFLKKRTG